MTIQQAIAKIGDKNPAAKLTQKDVKYIRKYGERKGLKRGWRTELAKKYKVKSSTISNVILGKSWKHVDEDETLFDKE